MILAVRLTGVGCLGGRGGADSRRFAVPLGRHVVTVFEQRLPEEEEGQRAAITPALGANQPERLELAHIPPDGSLRQVDILSQALHTGPAMAVIADAGA